jgi:hypothetical protein
MAEESKEEGGPGRLGAPVCIREETFPVLFKSMLLHFRQTNFERLLLYFKNLIESFSVCLKDRNVTNDTELYNYLTPFSDEILTAICGEAFNQVDLAGVLFPMISRFIELYESMHKKSKSFFFPC